MSGERFKELFLPLHPKLYRVAFALIGNKDDAEDILQEAYLKLWNRRDEFEQIGNPEAFCVTLIKNMSLDFLRSPKATRHEEEIDEAINLSAESSPADEMEREEEVEQIQTIIEQLPEQQKQVIRLRAIDDCSMNEIEEITGLSSTNIRTLLSRARSKIKEQFKSYYANRYER